MSNRIIIINTHTYTHYVFNVWDLFYELRQYWKLFIYFIKKRFYSQFGTVKCDCKTGLYLIVTGDIIPKELIYYLVSVHTRRNRMVNVLFLNFLKSVFSQIPAVWQSDTDGKTACIKAIRKQSIETIKCTVHSN